MKPPLLSAQTRLFNVYFRLRNDNIKTSFLHAGLISDSMAVPDACQNTLIERTH